MNPVYSISASFSGGLGTLDLTGSSNSISAALQSVAIDSRLRPLIIPSVASVTPNMDDIDYIAFTELEESLTIENPISVNPFDEGRKLLIRITDIGVSQNILYGDKYRGMIASLPSTTNPGKSMYLGFLYNSTDDMWDLIALSRQP